MRFHSAVELSRQNRQLFFTLLLAIVVAVAVGYLLEEGIGVVSEKGRVMELAEKLAECKTQEQYLELVKRNYPGNSPIWQSPAMSDSTSTVTAPASLEHLPGGRFRVVVFAVSGDRLLESNSYVYLPAALVDDDGRGHPLEDVRLNSRKSDLVFEYYYGFPKEGVAQRTQRYQFYLGRRHWVLSPVLAPK